MSEQPISLTDNAVRKVQGLIAAEANPDLKLRIYIVGGGCSGFQYGFKLEDTVNEDDRVLEGSAVTLVVDALSLHYLQGALVDYSEGLQGSKFIVHNPQAETTCGCGASFALKEE